MSTTVALLACGHWREDTGAATTWCDPCAVVVAVADVAYIELPDVEDL